MRKFLKFIFLFLIIAFLILFVFLFMGSPKEAKDIEWGVNFSQKHAKDLGLNWKETYLALLDDLKVRNLKIAAYWDLIEEEKGVYNFDDLDWQIERAEERGANVILVIGLKSLRWPECHIPDWFSESSKEEKNQKLLEYVEKIVSRYENSFAVQAWQIENEPFFSFGECPNMDSFMLAKEINTAKINDGKKRPIIVSDSGEFSLWFGAAQYADIVGITMYRKTWFVPPGFDSGNSEKDGFYWSYPFQPVFYKRKADLVKSLFDKEVWCVELQAEPWGPKLLYDLSIEQQKETMNLDIFRQNINFAKRTGLSKFYLWGGEWWYWMKKIQGDSRIWDEARNLFSNF
jgi:hypothetical protein